MNKIKFWKVWNSSNWMYHKIFKKIECYDKIFKKNKMFIIKKNHLMYDNFF